MVSTPNNSSIIQNLSNMSVVDARGLWLCRGALGLADAACGLVLVRGCCLSVL